MVAVFEYNLNYYFQIDMKYLIDMNYLVVFFVCSYLFYSKAENLFADYYYCSFYYYYFDSLIFYQEFDFQIDNLYFQAQKKIIFVVVEDSLVFDYLYWKNCYYFVLADYLRIQKFYFAADENQRMEVEFDAS